MSLPLHLTCTGSSVFVLRIEENFHYLKTIFMEWSPSCTHWFNYNKISTIKSDFSVRDTFPPFFRKYHTTDNAQTYHTLLFDMPNWVGSDLRFSEVFLSSSRSSNMLYLRKYKSQLKPPLATDSHETRTTLTFSYSWDSFVILYSGRPDSAGFHGAAAADSRTAYPAPRTGTAILRSPSEWSTILGSRTTAGYRCCRSTRTSSSPRFPPNSAPRRSASRCRSTIGRNRRNSRRTSSAPDPRPESGNTRAVTGTSATPSREYVGNLRTRKSGCKIN